MGTVQPSIGSSIGSPAPISINEQWYSRSSSQITLESSKNLNAKIVHNVSLLQLTDEERLLMGKLWTTDTLLKFAADLDEAAKRKVHGPAYEKMRQIFYTFSGFAQQICGIIQVGLQASPEYQPLLAGIAILLKAFTTRAETESKIVAHLQRIMHILPQVDYLRTVAGNSHMSDAVSGICLEVGNYMYEALHYFKKKGRIGKVLGAIVSSFDTKFGAHIQAIEAYVDNMRQLRETATLAVSLDTLGKLDETQQLLVRMIQQSQTTMMAMSLQLEQCRINTTEQLNFSARMRVQDICEALFPETLNIEKLIPAMEKSTQYLTPREKWENRGLQQPLQEWFQHWPRPMLCFSGPHSRNKISFLSSFSLDLASAVAFEPNIGLAYVFCDLFSNERLNTGLFARYLTVQLLQAHPKTALDHIDRISMRRVQAIRAHEASAAENAFKLFADTLSAARTQIDWPSKGYLIIIDRIDLLADSKGYNVVTHLLRDLQNLSTRLDDVSFIITANSAAGSFRNLRADATTHIEYGQSTPVVMQMNG